MMHQKSVLVVFFKSSELSLQSCFSGIYYTFQYFSFFSHYHPVVQFTNHLNPLLLWPPHVGPSPNQCISAFSFSNKTRAKSFMIQQTRIPWGDILFLCFLLIREPFKHLTFLNAPEHFLTCCAKVVHYSYPNLTLTLTHLSVCSKN